MFSLSAQRVLVAPSHLSHQATARRLHRRTCRFAPDTWQCLPHYLCTCLPRFTPSRFNLAAVSACRCRAYPVAALLATASPLSPIRPSLLPPLPSCSLPRLPPQPNPHSNRAIALLPTPRLDQVSWQQAPRQTPASAHPEKSTLFFPPAADQLQLLTPGSELTFIATKQPCEPHQPAPMQCGGFNEMA